MARPPCCRRISGYPIASAFKPAGGAACAREEVVMTLDEFEAIRLADLEGLYQEQAAERMEISRATFGRIIEIAHRKVAEALIRGKALKIEGGPVSPERLGSFRCPRCLLKWKGSHECPRCHTGGVCGDRSAGSAPEKGEQACSGRRVRRMGRKNT